MRHTSRLTAALALAAAAASTLAAPAAAAPTDSALLACGDTTVTVTGFGRGQVLKAVDSTANFVVVQARLEPQGVVVFDNPGQAGRPDVITCTTTAPSGQSFVFRGFFTPRA